MLQTKWGTLSLNDIISFLEEMKESNTDIQVVVFNEEKDRIVEIQWLEYDKEKALVKVVC